MSSKLQKSISDTISSDFAKNSVKLLSANMVAQAIGLLVYPLLTRLYGAEDFGLVSLFLSMGGVFALCATGEYQYAIMLPKSEKRAVACFQVGLFISIIVTLLVVVTVPFAGTIAKFFDAPTVAKWYALLPLFVFFSAFWVMLNYWYTRYKKFTNISVYQISQSIFGAGAKYGFGMMGCIQGGLVLATVLAPIVSVFISLFAGLKEVLKPLLKVDVKLCKRVAIEYINFPKYSLPRALVNNFSGNLPILLLTPFFGLSEVGFFAMAMTLAFRPINMICGSLYQVFFQRTAERVQNRQSIMPFFKKLIRNTMLIITPIFTGFYFILPWLSESLLGEGWSITGEYVRLMLPWLVAVSIGGVIGYISDIFQKQHYAMWIEYLYVFLRIMALLIGVYLKSFYISILLFSIVGCVVIIGQIIWYLYLISAYEDELLP